MYDASSRPDPDSPSLNECLEVGPSLHTKLREILIRNRMQPIALIADLKQAFLQIRVREQDRDVLRFHWIKDRLTKAMEILRFTRPLFGLIQSPFLLDGTTECHLDLCKEEFPETVLEILKSMYVDDIISGGSVMSKVELFKAELIEIFKRAKFELHKWNSNVPSLESDVPMDVCTEGTSAKEVNNETETAILGVKWNKRTDELMVTIPVKNNDTTKRGILQYLASIYDVLGLISPVLLPGKMMFREACELKLGWDKVVPDHLREKWRKWKGSLPKFFKVPRALPAYKIPVQRIDLHGFGDASIDGCCSVVYVVTFQESGISQGVVCANSRLSKQI